MHQFNCKPYIDSVQKRWQDTLVALKEAEEGKVIDAEKVHEWLKSWGTNNELEAPRLAKYH